MSTIGVDTGGTFTDLVYLRDDGEIEVSKRPSTPPDFSRGVTDVVDAIDQDRGVLAGIDYFYHGTTVATNAMITGSGAKIGFITTAGHRDVLPMMRIIGRSAGRSETELKQYSYSSKPEPIVPKSRIMEVYERVDYKGAVVVPLNEDSARYRKHHIDERSQSGDLYPDGRACGGACELRQQGRPARRR